MLGLNTDESGTFNVLTVLGSDGRLDVRPAVDVRVAPEVPNHVGAFDLPGVPNLVIADVFVFGEGHVKVVHAGGVDERQSLFSIRFAEGFDEVGQDKANEVFLIGRHGAHLDAREAGGFAREFDGLGAVFSARVFEKGGGALFAIEGLEDFVGAEGLEPVGVARVIGFFVEALSGMTVKDWATEGGANSAVAIAAASAVATCEDELELAGAGLTE